MAIRAYVLCDWCGVRVNIKADFYPSASQIRSWLSASEWDTPSNDYCACPRCVEHLHDVRAKNADTETAEV